MEKPTQLAIELAKPTRSPAHGGAGNKEGGRGRRKAPSDGPTKTSPLNGCPFETSPSTSRFDHPPVQSLRTRQSRVGRGRGLPVSAPYEGRGGGFGGKMSKWADTHTRWARSVEPQRLTRRVFGRSTGLPVAGWQRTEPEVVKGKERPVRPGPRPPGSLDRPESIPGAGPPAGAPVAPRCGLADPDPDTNHVIRTPRGPVAPGDAAPTGPLPFLRAKSDRRSPSRGPNRRRGARVSLWGRG